MATVAPTSERASYRGWAVGVSVYLLAVLHRTSLGVAGLLAEQRFHITPAQLSIFVLLQIGVYAGMQVPAGVLVDRYGPRRLLFIAATLMGFAQLSLFGGYSIYLAELFPTRLRSTGGSFCYNVGRFAAAAGPFTLGYLTKDVFGGYPEPMRYAGVAMSLVFLVGLAALPFAPETKGKPLPE